MSLLARRRTEALAVAACVTGVGGASGCSDVLGIGDWPDVVADAGGAALVDSEVSWDSSAESGSPCGLPADGFNGGLLLTDGYQDRMGFGMGYCYAFSDSITGGTSDSFVGTSNLCACGTSAVSGGSNWGAGIGCAINQTMCEDAGACPQAAGAGQAIDLAGLGIGIHYDLGTLPRTSPSGGIYLTVNNGGDELQCQISTPTGTCLWPMFIDVVTQTATLKGAPTGATHIQVQVSSGSEPESWQFCIVSLGFVPSDSSGIGDPCMKDQDCISSHCAVDSGGIGWCTKACTPTSDCNGSYPGNVNAYGSPNACAASSSCAPTCAQQSDCLRFEAHCVGGVCVLRSASAGIGDPCIVNDDCASHLCGGLGFCTSDCMSAADCYGSHPNNLNAQNTANACEAVDSLGDSSCFPECTQAADCSMLRGSSCEAVDGGVSVCAL